ncbi:MAG: carboxy-S-adenosyl-L-methionine synthase CmoA [Gammaproteobacteria bacterium]|nr:carboxy-S-adenosyl-L-methionine synthase CmoA [Gammaproteobacteria bacterium]NNC97113.1 carboxy-S-adenosyl-L-methionine synthase CmoA [Gammaproteobacteria bacterium]NNM14125.1 carboxy-S-adenosyl-L-methionine synthase CmoA [Gammaproteobacteria bacterium]
MSESFSNLTADAIYAKKITQVEDFRFDDAVASVFTDMVNRSIPAYADLVKYIGLLAQRYVEPDSRVYDLGCSLGAVSLSVDQSVQDKKFEIIAVDNSQAMLNRLTEVTKDYQWQHPFKTVVADIRDIDLQSNSFTVLNFVLQFLEPADRITMLQKIHASLNAGGALILSEKIKFDDPTDDALVFDLHHDFKRSQGYSELEIAQKRNALEEVMRLDTDSVQIQRLKDLGFQKVIKWFQAFNFVSYLAIK